MGKKRVNRICVKCRHEFDCDYPCNALKMIYEIIDVTDTERKREIVKNFKDELALLYSEPDVRTEKIAQQIIDRYPELSYIKEFDIKIGYVRSLENKHANGRITYADCRLVNEVYKAYLPFDFIITVYEINAHILSENQFKLLMLHELKHVWIGERGLTVKPHDIEDFEDILKKYGLEWNNFNQDVPDILAGGGSEKETKGNNLETKPKANSNSRTPSKSRGPKNKN